ncbi:MAG: 6,7-dimethyl-8-ribityllumazine synthase [Pseudomonadota bacterium]|nr:6,7-dimethyl-8-ribityllumazine synthase [Pseudomonadota bacterium]
MAVQGTSVLVIEARFYNDIADELLRGARTALASRGVACEVIQVPGALEIPVALSIAIDGRKVGRAGGHHGCVALGCVIRGETSHYDIVAGESARALMDMGVRHALPVGNGILTVDSREQAWVRAAIDQGNKGGTAVEACLALIEARNRFAPVVGR